MIQNFGAIAAYRTVSIKRPGLEFLQKSLLNVPYDRKNVGLNILSYRTYNRVMRVCSGKFRAPSFNNTPNIKIVKIVNISKKYN